MAIPRFVRDGIGSQMMKSLRIRFKSRSAPSVIVPVLLAVVLAAIQSASAQTNDAPTCATGSAVPNAAGNPGLVSDCEALLASRDTLAGTASLNWSAATPLAQWEGIMRSGTPQRVTRFLLPNKNLNGSVPATLG